MALTEANRREILGNIQKLIRKHHINVAGVDYDAWDRLVSERSMDLVHVDVGEFEKGLRELLLRLGSSHTGFFQGGQNRFAPQHTIGATLRRIGEGGQPCWMFLDVFDAGAANLAGIRPGDRLLGVDTLPVADSMPTFLVGHKHTLKVTADGNGGVRSVEVTVPHAKGTKQRPPIVEPKAVTHRLAGPGIGLVRVTYFSGAAGMRFTKELDRAIEDLKGQGCERLIVDLRGNIGGSLGFARLASYLCPRSIPIGHSLTPGRLRKGYRVQDLPPVPMPASKPALMVTMARFALRDKSVVLLTQGLGPQPFHGRTVILINEWTNSAAEMAAAFASENRLATLVGTKTAGNVLGAANFDAGHGYWVRLPIFGWYTAGGQSIEGKGVSPDQVVDVSPERLAAGHDDQFDRALELLNTLP